MAEEEGEPSAKRRRSAQKSTTELCKETTNSSSSRDSNDEPPLLSKNLPSTSDIQTITKPPRLPVDTLLLTVKNCEFLACYQELNDPYRCWFDGLGYVYFGEVGNESQQERVRAALLRCYRNGIGPGGSLISVTKAVSILRPKAVISVGTCSSLNPDKFKLGDVVVPAKLTTYASKVVTSDQEQSTGMRSCVSKRFLDVIKNCADGWQAPLKNPDTHEVKVHSDGEFLSGPELVRSENRRKELAKDHPHATAIEMEGEGIFTAAFDCQIEWLIVKGIADYADHAQMTEETWSPCASVMAASLVAHILSDSAVFQSWPHYEDLSVRSSASKSKEDLPAPRDSATAFLKWSNQLRLFYNGSMSKVMITPWNVDDTVDIDEVYVQLSFLRDDRKLTGTTKEKLQDYSEIFDGREHHIVPKRILVYGRPGIGKTTFTKKLAVDWSRGKKEILKKFSVVLLIKLRDVCNPQDLCAMLKMAELLSADDPMPFDQLCDYILKNQQNVLLVLDGFDEYSAAKSSEVHQIWNSIKLRDCTVLVTSRPLKKAELRPPSHAQFEINGFDREQVEQFVRKFHNDKAAIDEFIDLLDEHDLWEMAEIPLLLSMLCLSWGTDHQELLKSASTAHLFERFFQTLFDHAAAKTSDKEFRSIDEYKEDLSKLGKLAFDALLTDCLYLKFSKLPEDIRLLIKKYIAVGFLQVSKLSRSPCPEEIVSFLHKSIQEFLSAWFIVQELTNARNETPTCLSKLDSFEKIKKIRNKTDVFFFVFGLLEDCSPFFSHLQMIGKKEHLTEYNFTENPSIEDLSDNEREFCLFCFDLLQTSPDSKQQMMYPLFLQCVNNVLVMDIFDMHFLADTHFLKLSTLLKPNYLFMDDPRNKKQVVNDDGYSVMHDLETVVATCYGDTKPVNENTGLRYDDFFLKKEGQQMVLYLTKIHKQCYKLLSALTSEPESLHQKPVDHVWQNQDARSSLELTEKTSDQTQKHSLSFVRKIKIAQPTSKELMIVNNVLSFVKRPQVVDIKGDIEHEEPYDSLLVEKLVSHVSFTNSLVELQLSSINLTANCVAVIASSLHQAPNLHTLNLSYNPMYNGVRDLVENLHHTAHMHTLELHEVHLGDQECWSLATSLRHVERLQRLGLSGNPLGHGIIELVRHLHNVPHLAELDLTDTQMGKEEVIAVAHSLHYVDLKILWLGGNPLLGQGIIELARHLHSVPHLTELDLMDTQMGKEELIALARSLHNVDLKILKLSGNPLGQGIIELARHLHSVPHLTELHLRETEMGKDEVIAVARSLHNVDLKTLKLSDNPLGQGIIELARHLHSVPNLTKLYLHGTQMGKEEVIAVAHSLHNVVDLKLLWLSNNPLGQGIIELARHLHSVPHLTNLDVADTQMGEEEVIAVAHALKNVPELKNLFLTDNTLSRGISELIQHLSSIPKLRYLWLSHVQMTKKEATDLCTAVRGRMTYLYTDYHEKDPNGGYQLRTEAKLKQLGKAFDDE